MSHDLHVFSSPSGQSKGHGGSRLLEKLAADEGFQMNEDSSFSDGDEDGGNGENPLQSHRAPPAGRSEDYLFQLSMHTF